MSWAADLKVAAFFAGPQRFNPYRNGWVYTVLAPPEAVLARFKDDREEDEYVLDPDKLPHTQCVGIVSEDWSVRWARGFKEPDGWSLPK